MVSAVGYIYIALRLRKILGETQPLKHDVLIMRFSSVYGVTSRRNVGPMKGYKSAELLLDGLHFSNRSAPRPIRRGIRRLLVVCRSNRSSRWSCAAPCLLCELFIHIAMGLRKGTTG